jgi:nucleoside-diphosphate-sugar epimerase
MLIAITGGRGLLGRHICARLDERNIPYRTLGRRPAKESVDERHLVGSTTDADAVAALTRGATSLVHLARTTHELESLCRHDLAALATLVPVATSGGLRIHFASSQAVQGKARRYPVPRVDEDFPGHPDDSYGVMKLAWEEMLRLPAHTRAAQHVIYRMPIVIPATIDEGAPWLQSLLTGMMQRALTSGVITATSDDVFFGGFSYVHVEDAAAAIVDALVRPEVPGATYMLCADDYMTFADLAALQQQVARSCGRDLEVAWKSGQPGAGFSTFYDFSNARAKSCLAFSPRDSRARLTAKLRRWAGRVLGGADAAER